MRDFKLIERLRGGDTEALSKIMDTYSPYAYAVILNIGSRALSQEDMEEILSDCFITLWEKRSTLQYGSLKAYIAAIARTKTLDRLRALKVFLPLEDNIYMGEAQEPEAQALINELSTLAREAVDSLPEPDREIFKRHYFLYESCQSIGGKMHINPSTVKSKLLRGRQKLKEYLREKGYEYENTAQ